MIGVLEKSPGGEPHQADPTIIPPSKALPGMTFSLFDHPHFSALLKHEDIASLFGVEAEMTAMLRFETALAEAEAELGVIPGEAALAITEAAGDFEPDLEKLSEGVQQDGVIGPSLIASLKEAVPEAFRPFVHFGATSQDVVDTGLILRLQAAIAILKRDLKAVVAHLDRLSSEMGNVRIMGRTRMQRALPIAFDDRVATWKSPLMRHLQKLDHLENTALAVQFGGAVGTLHLLGAQGGNVRTALARRLDLIDPGRPLACGARSDRRYRQLAGEREWQYRQDRPRPRLDGSERDRRGEPWRWRALLGHAA